MTIEATAGNGRSGNRLYDARVRAVLYQLITVVLLVAAVGYLAGNTIRNLSDRGIASGFRFLDHPTGFGLPFSLIPYSEESSYGTAFLVGLLNTLFISFCGIVLATIIGFLFGVARLSKNWLLSTLAAVYLETARNVPLLLQILFWYFGVLTAMPNIRNSLSIGDTVFANNRGLYVPAPVPEPGFAAIPIAGLVAVVATVLLARWAKRRRERTGQPFHTVWAGLALIVGLPLLAAVATGLPLHWDYPVLGGFNFRGGLVLIPEFIALLLALTIYTAAFIGEIVRAGIQAVSWGQTEAAGALGLRPGQTLRLVVIPQAMRIIVPPLTSQYLNLTKNSSLAAAIGYPDLVAVFSGTVLNQTGQAVECVALTMLVYLTVSLGISALMNLYNRRIALVER